MIPFAPPRKDQRIIDAVTAVLRSGWITTATQTRAFEQKLGEYCGVPAVLCLNSATAGLELILRWYGVKDGDEVIVPVYTYAATSNVVVHCGAKVVFVDVNANDFNISVKEIERAITEKTKVIMPVDFGGYPCGYDAINSLVKRDDIKKKFKPNGGEQEKLGRILVLADAAHSIGASMKGKRSGALTDVSVFSFHAVKNLITAEGGAIALNLPAPFDNPAIYKTLYVKALHGQNKDAFAKMQKGNWRYDIVEPGYKCNMTDIAAAIGLVELERYENDTLPKRKHICELYSSLFKKYGWAQLPEFSTAEKNSCYHLYPLRIKNITETQRDAVIQAISEKEVAVNVHFMPVPMMSYYKGLGYDIKNYPVAFDNYSREISLPVFYDLTDEQVRTVADAVVTSYEQVIK
jgi:dTDP-4-amino-4,6-dideoxygalactose transaminase